MHMTLSMAAVLALLVADLPSANGSMSDIERRIAAQRTCEAAIWAMPAVSTYDIANAIRRDLGGELNDVAYMSRPMISRHGFLTANDVTPYAVAAMTTKDGPLVVDVPAASEMTSFFGTFVDAWMRPIADVGPTGSDEGQGAKYLFLPPGYQEQPPAGYLVFPLEIHGVNFAFRPVSRRGGTMADAAAYARQIKVYPLATAADPPATRMIDAYPKIWNTLPTYDLSYFEDLWNVVQHEPVLTRDKTMTGLLATIGIEKGTPFQPGPELKQALEEGAKCAVDYLQNRFTTPGQALVPYWGGEEPMAGHLCTQGPGPGWIPV